MCPCLGDNYLWRSMGAELVALPGSGQPLTERMGRYRMTLRDYLVDLKRKCSDYVARVLFGQLLEGSVFLYDNVVAQRDMKSDNILLEFDDPVHVFSSGASSKILDNALKQLKTTKAVMGFSVNEESGKVLVLAKVDKFLIEGGLNANQWVNEVCTVLGGRGGGKEANAQATGGNIERLDEAVALARSGSKKKCEHASDFCYNMTVALARFPEVVMAGCSNIGCRLSQNRCIEKKFRGRRVTFCCCNHFDLCNSKFTVSLILFTVVLNKKNVKMSLSSKKFSVWRYDDFSIHKLNWPIKQRELPGMLLLNRLS
ncbi:unnamed protein product [Cylicocyclus nassatus]|uniref:DHHA1 domain-containing protein n=1 Tax=Cylicocyclus nassatus TaxID=53992 RepID=A0AA36GKS3_CYLNA|nr:unnamed protein product [Cylicocyclus nassatus]